MNDDDREDPETRGYGHARTERAEPESTGGDALGHELRQFAHQAPLPLRVGDVIGHYRLAKVLGHGGQGVVFEAIHVKIPQLRCAIKTLRPPFSDEQAEEFLKEANSVVRISHPNVIRILDVGKAESDAPYISMELVGPDLTRYTEERGGTLPPELAIGFCMQVCSALTATHSEGIVHRDIKPSNCLVRRVGGQDNIVVVDFGIARAIQNSSLGAWTVAGSFGYMAPEILNRQPNPDHRVDVYSVGAMLFFLLTGKTPTLNVFQSSDAADLGVPAELVRTLRRAHASDPKMRHDSAQMLAEELQGVLQTLVARASRAAPPAPSERSGRGLLVLTGLLTLAVIVVLAILLSGVFTRSPAPAGAARLPEPPDEPDREPPRSNSKPQPDQPRPPTPEPEPPDVPHVNPEPPKDPPKPAPSTIKKTSPTPKPKSTPHPQEMFSKFCAEAAKRCASASDLKRRPGREQPILTVFHFTLAGQGAEGQFSSYGMFKDDQRLQKCLLDLLPASLKTTKFPGPEKISCKFTL